jgi:two-component system LytT family response regulator
MQRKLLLIEDDHFMAEMITDVLKDNFPQLELGPVATSLSEAEKTLSEFEPDVVISDINLQDDVVFTLFQKLDEIAFKIIFITSHSKYAVQAFRFSALDFLEKPFEDDALISAVNKAIEHVDIDQYNAQLRTFFHNFNPGEKKKKLVLKNLESIHIVDISDIRYIKSDSNYSEFHIDDGRKILISKSLKLYDEQLRGFSFFRSHQSYLVNLQFAKTFHKQDSVLELVSGDHIAVSGAKVNALLHNLSELS